MAKQKGITLFEGTMGGINFYFRKGVPVARQAGGGFNGKKIKTHASMKRVRELNTEFANSSAVNKHFKYALIPLLIGYVDGTLHSRLMGLFMAIKNYDLTSVRGQRKVALGMETAEGKTLMKGFAFTPKHTQLLNGMLAFDWGSYSLTVTNFNLKAVVFPANADYMEVTLGVLRFNFESYDYRLVQSVPFIIDREATFTDFSLSTVDFGAGSGQRMALVRVRFYQVVNGAPYYLDGNGAFGLGVIDVA